MATITLSVPEELKKEMSMFPELNWSAVARKAIVEKIRLLEKLDRELAKSKLTEEDTIALGRKVKHEVSKRFMKG